MPDATISAAIAEAYASAPIGQIIWETIELWHPSWTDPLYVVRDGEALDARIEAGAARNAGAIVTFTAYPFDLVPPDQSGATVPQATLEIDNTSREIGNQLDAAILAGHPITVIWRTYLSGNELDGPEHLPPVKMELKSASVRSRRIRATAGFRDLLNAAFPATEYDVERFPGLVP